MDPIKFFDKYIAGQDDELYDFRPDIDATGDLKRLTGIDVVINSIRNLLLTPLGQYPFDPEYGSLLFNKVFEAADSITQREIEYEVRQRITRYEDRVEIVEVSSAFFEDYKSIQVNVKIKRGEVTGDVTLVVPTEPGLQLGLDDPLSAELLENRDV